MLQKLYIITGAGGHLAGTIIRYLQNTECLVRGLLLPGESLENQGNVTYVHGDVTQPETLVPLFAGSEQYDTIVIHAAGLISIGSKITPKLYSVNVEGTKNVIRLCQEYSVRRLVYVSSVHAIEEAPKKGIIREVTSFSKDRVIGAYARTKAEATQAVLDAAKDGLDAVVVHPSGILGPFDQGKNHIIQMVKTYLAGHLPAGVKGGYDFVDVRDVAQGCLAAAERGKAGECYILSNRYLSIKDLLAYLQKLTGGKKMSCLPIQLAKIAAPFSEALGKLTGKRPLFTRYSLYTLQSNGNFSHEKATKALGYHPRDLKDTLRDTVTYLKTGDCCL
ncbi:MAG TPA: NAD-dependent epimerase/dehydratase family protein [Candidatus Faecousia intestinigallinarum]|nr:NAD-dependent epimerase/dehydratase family protein [Candidatus Faecousia intestinigallinarum]